MQEVSTTSSNTINEAKNIPKKKIEFGHDPLNIMKNEKEQKKKEAKEKRNQKMFQKYPVSTGLMVEDTLSQSPRTQEKDIMIKQEDEIETKKPNDQKNDGNLNEFFKSIKNNQLDDCNSIEKKCLLMAGEIVKEYHKTSYRNYDKKLIGFLAITNYRLIFKFEDEQNYKKMNFHPNYFNIPFFYVEKLTKVQDKEGIFSYPIDILLKDTRLIRFHIWDTNAVKFYSLIHDACFPRDAYYWFTFTSEYRNALFQDKSYCINGWELYDAKAEFLRQGVSEENDLNLRYCDANKDFQLCATYPKFLIVHKEMTDEQLKDASNHRTKNRLPALTYYYGRKKSKNIKACPSIWRSSQTKSGITGKNKSNMDIMLLEKITKLCAKLYIFDARPYINALANRVNGGGFENVNHYSNVDIIFCEIDNIHVARTALVKYNQLSLSSKIMDNQKFWSSLESTGWYNFVHLMLKYSNEICMTLQKHYSVLIHCSDGWDRSSQLISLSQILVDPYFRTIKGLACLIEKDWLSFGHQFGLRNGIYFKEMSEIQHSPIFLQFLDCLHQLLIQFPNAFEFNDEFLVFLANSYNSNLYGTFMFNSEKERCEKNARTTTASVWSDVFKNITQYRNVYYQPDNPIEILNPNYAPYNLVPWHEFFMQYNLYIENSSFRLSDKEQNISFKTNREFYEYHKRMDVLNYTNFELKYDRLTEVLNQIYSKTKDNEIFKLFNESTQSCLTTLSIQEQNKDSGSDGENEKKEMTESQISKTN